MDRTGSGFCPVAILKLLYCKYLIMEQVTIMATEATRQQALHYGCIVQDRDTSEVTHYVEKPSTFVSTLINCGVYICSTEIFQTFAAVFNKRQQEYYKLVNLPKSCKGDKTVVRPCNRTTVRAQCTLKCAHSAQGITTCQ